MTLAAAISTLIGTLAGVTLGYLWGGAVERRRADEQRERERQRGRLQRPS